VVKSHGSADETGVAAAVGLAFRLAQNDFSDKIAARLALATAQIEAEAGTEGQTL
jgi:glycerol-3-phosphate acyltransferase PlsX